MAAQPPKTGQPQPGARPVVERGDELYFEARGKPFTGKVLSHGEHGCTLLVKGQRHPVRWEHVRGVKTRVQPALSIVDQGEDGFIAKEQHSGKLRYVHDPVGVGEEDLDEPDIPTLAKALALRNNITAGPSAIDRLKALRVKQAEEELTKAIKNGAGLSLQDTTDKTGRHTKRWMKTSKDQPKERQRAAPEAKPAPKSPGGTDTVHGYGQHNLDKGDKVKFKAGSFEGDGHIVDHGKLGARVKDGEGRIHKVHWAEIQDHTKAGPKDATKEPAKSAAPKTDGDAGKPAAAGDKADSKPAKKPAGKGDNGGPPNGRDPRHVEGAVFKKLPPGGIEALVEKVDAAVEKAGMGALFDGWEADSLPKTPAGPFKDWTELSAAQGAAQEALVSLLSTVGADVGARKVEKFEGEHLAAPGAVWGVGPPKEADSAARKVNDKYGGDWSRLGDAVRGSMGFDTVDDMKAGLAKLKAAGLKLATRPENKFVKPTSAGYRDLNLNITLPNGVVGELQVHLKPILEAKRDGHKSYDVSRVLEGKAKASTLSAEEAQQLHDHLLKQRVLYTRAMQAALGE